MFSIFILKNIKIKIIIDINMYSHTRFTPGNRSNSSRMINYVAEYNARFPNSPKLNCECIHEKYDKNIIGSDSASTRVSSNTRISQIIKTSLGGKTQYGNFYLGQPLSLNYLGRAEGMPGGSGSAPKNRF
jgi:hypothetical protein